MLSADEIREMNEAYRQDFNRHDAEALRGYYADTVDWTDVGASEPITDPARIPIRVAAFFASFPDVHLEFEDDFSEGLLNAHHWVMRGTNTGPIGQGDDRVEATGRRMELRGLTMLILNEDGKIVSDHTYYDPSSLNRQLGLD